jgi:hypothetical protein
MIPLRLMDARVTGGAQRNVAFVRSLLVGSVIAGAYPFHVRAGQQIASWQTR